MRIPEWMLTEEMKQTEHLKLYVVEFEINVSMTRSQPIESTQGTIRTSTTPRSPNPVAHQGELSAPRSLPSSGFQDETTQISLATARSIDDFEINKLSRKLMSNWLEIEKIVEGNDDVDEN
ncbi:hypothetical protein Tco_1012469 [Tanacetum coccineum]